MEQTVVSLSKYATPEVVTVLGTLIAAWLGWKVTSKSFGIVKGVAQKFSFLGLTAALLFMAGLGGTGVGVGEIAQHWSSDAPSEQVAGMSDETLADIAKSVSNSEVASDVLAYAKDRDARKDADHQLTSLVASANEENREAVIEYLKYLQMKEGNVEHPISYVSTVSGEEPTLATSYYGGEDRSRLIEPVYRVQKAPEIREDADFILSLPAAFALTALGLGMAITGVVVQATRKS